MRRYEKDQRGIEGNTVFFDQGRAAETALVAPQLANADSILFVYTGPDIKSARGVRELAVDRDVLEKPLQFLQRVSDVFASVAMGGEAECAEFERRLRERVRLLTFQIYVIPRTYRTEYGNARTITGCYYAVGSTDYSNALSSTECIAVSCT